MDHASKTKHLVAFHRILQFIEVKKACTVQGIVDELQPAVSRTWLISALRRLVPINILTLETRGNIVTVTVVHEEALAELVADARAIATLLWMNRPSNGAAVTAAGEEEDEELEDEEEDEGGALDVLLGWLKELSAAGPCSLRRLITEAAPSPATGKWLVLQVRKLAPNILTIAEKDGDAVLTVVDYVRLNTYIRTRAQLEQLCDNEDSPGQITATPGVTVIATPSDEALRGMSVSLIYIADSIRALSAAQKGLADRVAGLEARVHRLCEIWEPTGKEESVESKQEGTGTGHTA